MADQKSDIARFAVGLIEAAHRRLYEATDGLMEEQLYYQPSPETNSIGWLAWHLSRWKDYFAATFTGEEQVWVSQGWAQRFGMDERRTGLGDTLEQVAAFRVDRELLFGYVDAANKEAVARASASSLATVLNGRGLGARMPMRARNRLMPSAVIFPDISSD